MEDNTVGDERVIMRKFQNRYRLNMISSDLLEIIRITICILKKLEEDKM